MDSKQLSPVRKTIVGTQFLFVAFGATVLMPLLVGLDPATALFSAGIGTIIFHLVTRGKVPIFLGSSFAFIAPILLASKQWGLEGTLSGFAGVALVYFVASALIKWRGTDFLSRLFPPVVVGPVIILIGLSLSGTAVDMSKSNWTLAIISLLVSIGILTYARGMFKLIPVVGGIAAGYVAAMVMGLVDFSGIASAPWVALPKNIAHPLLPTFDWQPFICLMPIALATLIEHVGDVYVVSNVAGKDFITDPGLHRTMLGDGLACLAASFMGGPPVTTYSEVTGAMQITKITSPAVIRITALAAIVFSVFGKLNAFLQSIPQAVLGGIMLMLFGTIATVGIQSLVRNKVDFSKTRNIIIASIMLTTGVGGAELTAGTFSLSGIGLAAIVGIILNLLLPSKTKMDETEEEIKQ
ncbi:MAG: uracil-xanthine permease [Muribaculaceae bacterium]|nr:uracil-xanthine permease [Muribaculaceae bacterium]